jgi:hypothetical protein
MNLNNIIQIVVRVLPDFNRKAAAARVFRFNYQPEHVGYCSGNPTEMER